MYTMGNHPSRTGGPHTPNGSVSSKNTGPPSTAGPDGGHLIPMSGTYPAVPQEWDKEVVARLILNRQLAPFYRGLQDEFEAAEDEEDQDTFLDDSPRADDGSAMRRGVERQKRYAELEGLLDRVGIKEDQEHIGDHGLAGQRHNEPAVRRKAEVDFYERGTTECPICMLCVRRVNTSNDANNKLL